MNRLYKYINIITNDQIFRNIFKTANTNGKDVIGIADIFRANGIL